MENDLFDFLLFSLPDNDTYSHRVGPENQPVSIAEADRALGRLMEAAGGTDDFLADHAVIVMSDHSQNLITHEISLASAVTGVRALLPSDPDPDEAEVALCPGARSAQVYVLGEDRGLAHEVAAQLEQVEGVDLVIRRDGDEGVVSSERGTLRFRSGGDLTDKRGGTWGVTGDHAVLDLTVNGGEVSSGEYPHALARLWSALKCDRTGDVLVSAKPGYDFIDWGGHSHLGGGSHGSLHRCDSLGVMLTCGIEMPEREQWSIEDATPLVLDHLGVAA